MNRIIGWLSILLVAVVLSGCSLFRSRIEYPAPAVPEGFVLVDAYEAGRPADYVKFHHAGIRDERLGVEVRYHDVHRKEWLPYGTAYLKCPRDHDTMVEFKDVGGGLQHIRYFAVRFSDDKVHALSLIGAHHDLNIYVGDAQ